ncbi:MAG: 2-oxo acid dehydrogenase subunit E2, partial [Pirellula sp.]
ERLIWGRIQSPHQLAIDAVQSSVDRFTHGSIDEVFADGLRMERRPAILRRATWWLLTRCCGRKRAKHVGTFSISSLGQLGALNGYHPLVTTSSLAIGPLERDGKCDVALICDHRVIDGVLAARALQRLERLLLESADGLQIPQPFSTAA